MKAKEINVTINYDLNKYDGATKLFVARKLSRDDIAKINDFCNATKMVINSKLEKYDYESANSNVLLCNFGKSVVCRTASVWYSPKNNDYCVRLEETTRKNLMRSDVNAFLLSHCYDGIEQSYSTKEKEYRYSFSTLDSALSFFSTLQSNYRKFIADTKEIDTDKEVTTA